VKENMISKFIEYFDDNIDNLAMYFSPGRVNLIGEHIDYNGGLVMPCAINLGTYALIRPRLDREVHMISLNFEDQGIYRFNLGSIEYDIAMDWCNYPMGIFNEIQRMGNVLDHGFDVLFFGDLPNGAGLSSSASIEVLTATMINDHYALGFSKKDIALLSQRSENQFNGVNCGIMDQFSIAMCEKDHAILLDCNTLEYDHVPLELGEYLLMIVNTNKKRGLVDSAYNARRIACDLGLKALNEAKPLSGICELTPKEWLTLTELMPSEEVYKRTHHAVMEQYRTQQASIALKSGDLMAFGEWMYRSHDSLRYHFEVSCDELDIIVDAGRPLSGVLGARMTGAGFGGCVVALVHKAHVEDYENHIRRVYTDQTGLVPSFYKAVISSGAGVWHE